MQDAANWDLPPERFLTQQEIGALLVRAHELMALGKARKRKPLVRDAMLIFTALYTGLRRAEICELMVQDLGIGNGRSHIVVRNGKGGKRRVVHVGKAYKAILRDYIKATVCLVAKSFARRSARTGPTAEAAESPTSGAPLRPVGLFCTLLDSSDGAARLWTLRTGPTAQAAKSPNRPERSSRASAISRAQKLLSRTARPAV